MAIQEYVCVCRCHHGPPHEGRKVSPRILYEPGMVEYFDPDLVDVPAHFKLKSDMPGPSDQIAAQREFERSVRLGVKAPLDEEKILMMAKFDPIDATKRGIIEAEEAATKGKK